jgi:hypothetical protein
MRFKLIIALTALAFAPRAFAIKPASEDAKEAIRIQIVAANLMDKDVIAAKRALEKTSFPKDSPDYLRLARTARRVRDKQYTAYTKAIYMTITAYDLEPRSLRGTSVMPWTKGRELVWLPVAGEDPTRELEDSRGNKKETSRTPLDWAGRTFTDGVTYINPETLRMGPDFLASTLLHERTHFEQHTTRGRGDTVSTAESEVEAYQAELDNLDYFFDKSNPNREGVQSHIQTLLNQKQAKVDEQRAAKKGIRGIINRILPPTPNPDFNDATLHTDAELEALKKQSDKFSAEAQANERQLAQRARMQAEIARRDHDERLKNTYAELAQRSCASPGSVAQAELDALPRPYGTDVMNTMPRGLSECAGHLYSRLLHGATADEIRRSSELKNSEGFVTAPTPDQPALPSDPKPVRGRRVQAFSTMLPAARHLSVTACGSPDHVAIDAALTTQPYDIAFSPRNDDRIIAELSGGLGECESRLFRRLIEVIRNGEGPGISVRWVQETAAAYRPAPVYYPPPSGGRCEDYGNVRCPH